jgi:hypothetical protein
MTPGGQIWLNVHGEENQAFVRDIGTKTGTSGSAFDLRVV